MSKSWPTVKLSEVSEINPRRPASLLKLPDDYPVTFVPMPAVEQFGGTICTPEIRGFGEVRKGFTYFADGDVIFAKITPCMQNGKSAVAHSLVNQLGFGSTEFHVIRPNPDKVLAEWIWHFVRQGPYRREATHHFQGAVGQQRVPAAYLESTSIPLPSLSEQKLILARIKECMERVEEIERLRTDAIPERLALLRSFYHETYQSLMTEHSVKRLGELGFSSGGGTPSKNNPAFWSGTIPWISPKDMKKPRLSDATLHISEDAIKGSAAKLIPAGSVLFVVRGMILAHTLPVAVNEIDAAINQDMKAITPSEDVLPEFLASMMRGAERELLAKVEIAGHGTCRLQTEHWASLPIPVPTLDQQQEIMAKASAFESLSEALSKDLKSFDSTLRDAILRKAFAGEL